MKSLIALVPLVAMLTALVLLGVADSAASIADATAPNDQVASSVGENNSPQSANATITIIMRTAPLPDK